MKFILTLLLPCLFLHLITVDGQRRSRRLQEKIERARLADQQNLIDNPEPDNEKFQISEILTLEKTKQSDNGPQLQLLSHSAGSAESFEGNSMSIDAERLQEKNERTQLTDKQNLIDNPEPDNEKFQIPEIVKPEITKQSDNGPHLKLLSHSDGSAKLFQSNSNNIDDKRLQEKNESARLTDQQNLTHNPEPDNEMFQIPKPVKLEKTKQSDNSAGSAKSFKSNSKKINAEKVKNVRIRQQSSVVRVDPGYVTEPIRVGSWNVQRLGLTKMSKPEVVAILVQVIRRYDILVVLEVVDKSQKAPQLLLDALNDGLDDPYNLTIGERQGDTSYKEQYAFYYKPSRVSATKTYQYEDKNNTFQVPPFVVAFEGKTKGLAKFAIVPIHTKPDNAVEEVDALVDVYDAVKNNLSISDVMIMGDYNSGCDYVTGNEWDKIRLYTNKNFTWLISGHADTTTKSTSCPYDRIVIRGSDLEDSVYKNSAGPYYFDEAYGLTNQDLIEDVSDHYPVEVLIRGQIPSTLDNNINNRIFVGVSVDVTVTSEAVALMVDNLSSKHVQRLHSNDLSPSCRSISSDCSTGTDVVMVNLKANGTETAIEILNKANSKFPDIVTMSAVRVLTYKLSHDVLNDAALYGKSIPATEILLSLMCQPTIGQCTISVRTPTTIN